MSVLSIESMMILTLEKSNIKFLEDGLDKIHDMATKQLWHVVSEHIEFIAVYTDTYLEIYNPLFTPYLLTGTCNIGIDIKKISNKILKKILLRDKFLFPID